MKKSISILGLIGLMVASFTSCSLLRSKEDKNLVNQWKLESIGDRKYTKIEGMSKDEIVLSFRADNLFGTSDGCNGLGGEYILDGKNITFRNINSTKMYCNDEIMKNLYYVPFLKVKSYKIEKEQLLLLDEKGKEIAKYTKKSK